MELHTEYKLLKFATALMATINILAPIVCCFLVSYKFDNWLLMIGIVFAFIGSFIFAFKGSFTIVAIASILSIGFWMKRGFNIYQFLTFYYLCFLFGFISCGIMTKYNRKKAIVDEKLYEMVKHELAHGETGKKLQKEIEEGMKKVFGEKKNNGTY